MDLPLREFPELMMFPKRQRKQRSDKGVKRGPYKTSQVRLLLGYLRNGRMVEGDEAVKVLQGGEVAVEQRVRKLWNNGGHPFEFYEHVLELYNRLGTLEAVGATISLTRERVRQILNKGRIKYGLDFKLIRGKFPGRCRGEPEGINCSNPVEEAQRRCTDCKERMKKWARAYTKLPKRVKARKKYWKEKGYLYAKRYYAEVKRRGVCSRCQIEKARTGHTACESCAKKFSEKVRMMLRKRHEDGLCVACKKPSSTGRWKCLKCVARELFLRKKKLREVAISV